MSFAMQVKLPAHSAAADSSAPHLTPACGDHTKGHEPCESTPLLFSPRTVLPMHTCARTIRERLTQLTEPVSASQVQNATTQYLNSMSTVAALIAGLSFGALLFQFPSTALADLSSPYLPLAHRIFFFTCTASLLFSLAALVGALSALWLQSLGLMAFAGLPTGQFVQSHPRRAAKVSGMLSGVLMTLSLVSFLMGMPAFVWMVSRDDSSLALSAVGATVAFSIVGAVVLVIVVVAFFSCVRHVTFSYLTLVEST